VTRTTLNLAADVLDELKLQCRSQGKSLGELASELLANGLAGPSGASAKPLRWNADDLGFQVDLADKEAVRRALQET